METQEIRYRVNKKVFRQASLYAMFLRNRNTFRVGIAVVLAVAFYTVLAVQGTFPLSYLPIYIAAAYLVWMLLLLGREEQRVLRYLKSDESLLGTEYVLRFDAGKLSVEVPEKKLRNTVALAKLASAIEISSVFMLCLTADQLYLVPTAAMTDEQRTALRGLLSSRLGERFYSSILARPPPTSLRRRALPCYTGRPCSTRQSHSLRHDCDCRKRRAASTKARAAGRRWRFFL